MYWSMRQYLITNSRSTRSINTQLKWYNYFLTTDTRRSKEKLEGKQRGFKCCGVNCDCMTGSSESGPPAALDQESSDTMNVSVRSEISINMCHDGGRHYYCLTTRPSCNKLALSFNKKLQWLKCLGGLLFVGVESTCLYVWWEDLRCVCGCVCVYVYHPNRWTIWD